MNTPNSVAVDSKGLETYSPWIFHELAIVDKIQINKPSRHKQRIMANFSNEAMLREKVATENLEIIHEIPDERLINTDFRTVRDWANTCQKRGLESLDSFYEIFSNLRSTGMNCLN